VTYFGYPGGLVFVEHPSLPARVPLPPQLRLRNHSPTGFSWGYGGSGPAQLALAILVDYFKNKPKEFVQDRLQETPFDKILEPHERLAVQLYQDFKFKVIGRLTQDLAFTLTEAEVEQALTEILATRKP